MQNKLKVQSSIVSILSKKCLPKNPILNFHQLGPLGRVGLVVVMSIYVYIYIFRIYVPSPCDSPRGAKKVPREQSRLSLALRSHDQNPANGGDVARDCNWPGKGLLHIIIQQLPNKDKKNNN